MEVIKIKHVYITTYELKYKKFAEWRIYECKMISACDPRCKQKLGRRQPNASKIYEKDELYSCFHGIASHLI